jgi:hypothetical protein
MVRNRSRSAHHPPRDLLGGELSTEGDGAAARSHLSAARAHCMSYGENYLAAEMDRLEALLLQCEGAPTEVVEECLAKALDTARPQGTRLFELRSATALAVSGRTQ